MKRLIGIVTVWASIGLAPVASAKTLALKDFREMLVGLSVATGVNYRDTEIQAIYTRVRTRLPLTGEVTDMSSPMVLALTELAGAFCQKMIQSDAELTDVELRHAHRDVDFRRGPSALSEDVILGIVDDYTMLFWQRAATDAEERLLAETLITAREAAEANSASDTLDVLKVGCAAAATSLAALLN